jgi:hypothetical protein
MTHDHSGRKFGHGLEDRPPRHVVRAEEMAARAAKSEHTGKDAAGNIVTDDEWMQSTYDLVNKGVLDAAKIKELAALYPPPPPPKDNMMDEVRLRRDELESAHYMSQLKVPEHVRGKFRIVDDDMDYLALTGTWCDAGGGRAGRRGSTC